MLVEALQKYSLTLQNWNSGEEERQKGLHFLLFLFNSKKPTIKNKKVLKIKRGKEKQEAQWMHEEEGSPWAPSCSTAERADQRPQLRVTGCLVCPCRCGPSLRPAGCALQPNLFLPSPAEELGDCDQWHWLQLWPGGVWLDLDELPPHGASLWASPAQPFTCLSSCSLAVA